MSEKEVAPAGATGFVVKVLPKKAAGKDPDAISTAGNPRKPGDFNVRNPPCDKINEAGLIHSIVEEIACLKELKKAPFTENK